MSRLFPIVVAGAVALGGIACGGSKPPPKMEEAPPPEATHQGGEGPTVEQELGSLDEQAVSKKFDDLLNTKLEACHQKGRERVEFLSGDAKAFLRIGKDGRVKYGFLETSTLGDRETEKCIVDALLAADWPKPKGGEGEARNSFGWSPGSERPPTSWGPEKVNGALAEEREVHASIEKCRVGVTGDFRVTAYVEPGEPAALEPAAVPAAKGGKGGKPAKPTKKPPRKEKKTKGGERGRFKALGVVAPNREAIDKIDCIADALRPLPLPSPGSYVAKVTFLL